MAKHITRLTSKWPDWQSHLDPDLFGKDGK